MIRSCVLRLAGLMAALSSLAGCDSSLGPEARLPPETQTLLETDRGSYVLHRSVYWEERKDETRVWFETRIPYSFRNESGAPVSLLNCRGAFGHHLEYWSGDAWIPAWWPVQFQCLSPPIVIAQEATVVDTLWVGGFAPGVSALPQFHQADPTGIYRIVWDDAYHGYHDFDGESWGSQLSLEQRVSNWFRLKVEDAE